MRDAKLDLLRHKRMRTDNGRSPRWREQAAQLAEQCLADYAEKGWRDSPWIPMTSCPATRRVFTTSAVAADNSSDCSAADRSTGRRARAYC